MRLSMRVEDNIRVFDIQYVPGQHVVARLKDAASFQVRDGAFIGFFDIGLVAGGCVISMYIELVPSGATELWRNSWENQPARR